VNSVDAVSPSENPNGTVGRFGDVIGFDDPVAVSTFEVSEFIVHAADGQRGRTREQQQDQSHETQGDDAAGLPLIRNISTGRV
jgi:hypothetical protein